MRILITGGTGTFGRVATRAFLAEGHTVTVFSRDEQKQETMAYEFKGYPHLQFFLGDVRDKDRLRQAMRGRDIVVHAAALKIVPKCEFDPIEAVKTNVLGSQNVVEGALESGIRQALLVSTDKAVQPVNLYGATKKTAEHLFLAANNLAWRQRPAFGVVRYGNVFRSRGSVVEAWLKASREGHPCLITNPSMTRFFMTPQEAADLVRYALGEMQGGEIFVPKLRAYTVRELSEAFQAVFPHAVFQATGSRPGEKIHEDLISSYELQRTFEVGPHLAIRPTVSPEGNFWSTFAVSSLTERMTLDELKYHIVGKDAIYDQDGPQAGASVRGDTPL